MSFSLTESFCKQFKFYTMVSFLLILSFRTSQRDGTFGCCHRLEGIPILSQLNLPYGPYHWSWIKSSKIVSIGISFVESRYFNFHLQVMTHIFVFYLALNATLLTSKMVVTISNCSRRNISKR